VIASRILRRRTRSQMTLACDQNKEINAAILETIVYSAIVVLGEMVLLKWLRVLFLVFHSDGEPRICTKASIGGLKLNVRSN